MTGSGGGGGERAQRSLHVGHSGVMSNDGCSCVFFGVVVYTCALFIIYINIYALYIYIYILIIFICL